MRQIGIVRVSAKRELEDFHTWKTELQPQCFNLRRNQPKVFCYHRKFPKCFMYL